jgi:hypothetical protein
MDTVYIDSQEIKSTWGLNPIYEKFYSSLMQFPDIKDRVSNDYTDENGIEVYYTKGYLKSREPTMSFGVDTYAHYLTFMDYITSKDTFVLSSSIIGSITLEYISTSDFDAQGITFEIKVRERNFNDR